MEVDSLIASNQERPILALNCGSSSLKFGLYQNQEDGLKLLAEGEGEKLGGTESSFWYQVGDGEKQTEATKPSDHHATIELALQKISSASLPLPQAVGHRIVHGGPKVLAHQLLRPDVWNDLQAAAEFAPLHVPPALKAITAISEQMPEAKQVVCLDTAFHADLPDVSRSFALPRRITEMGVHRYGFHGLSLESIIPRLKPLPDRLVVAHLGGGCSVTAIEAGKSKDTTMGLTPTGGIMMGTRCGDVDPGVALYLQRNGFEDAEELEKLFDKESGLRGVSGMGSDMREIVQAQSSNAQADLARRMFVYQLRKAIAAMAACLGGIDALVLTGGIGEHDAPLREELQRKLSFLGAFAIHTLPSLEDQQIAAITLRLTAGDATSG